MRLLGWLCLLTATASAHRSHRNYDDYDYFALHLDEQADPKDIAYSLGAVLEGKLGEIPNHYTFSCPKHDGSRLEESLQELKARRRKKRDIGRSTLNSEELVGLDGILWHQKQELKKRHVKRTPPPLENRQEAPASATGESTEEQKQALSKLEELATTLSIKDPIFKEQWHLFNPVQLGHDLNVTGVWLQGFTGNGTISAVIDDGLDLTSEDLKPNYYAEGSWDFNDNSPEPKPRLFDDKHGTRCAGEIAAAKNDVCGVGMAYDGQIAGIRILSKPISDEDEALAINYHYQENQIYSCSWGPPDDGRTMEGPGLLIQKAMVNGIQQGRSGLGSVFVFAAGNGAASDDNCNFDGYTNSIYSITVGGIDRAGNHPYYSELCSAQLVVTYSSGHGDAIHTTDVGHNQCYNGHGGTSAAGPLVVGAAALALSARPDLTWRDLQYLVVDTAIPIHLDDGEWQTTSIGKKFSHTYGYGKMDAYRYVEAAKNFQSRKPQAWYHSPWLGVQHPIPEGDKGLAASFDVTEDMLKEANFERVEHVTVTMNVEHTRRGDLSVELRSPEGLISYIATTRRSDDARAGYDDWTFMSVVHWGESGIGTWTVIVKDTIDNEFNGTFVDWRLNLWGECIDPAIQDLHPMPEEHDDDHELATAIISTTLITTATTTNTFPAITLTGHPERPTKVKPTDAVITFTKSRPGSATATPTVSSAPEPTHTTSDSFLPGFFPTFGVSKRTQVWIYGSIVLIVLFCIGLGVYFLIQRKKRLRNSRDDYEFEILNDDGADEAKQGLTGSKKNRKKRGGELYDAFAGESDDDVFSSDDEGYQDTPDQDTGSGSGSSGSPQHRTES